MRHVAAPGAPRDVTVTWYNASDVLVQWSPPRQTNGRLDFYQLRYYHNSASRTGRCSFATFSKHVAELYTYHAHEMIGRQCVCIMFRRHLIAASSFSCSCHATNCFVRPILVALDYYYY